MSADGNKDATMDIEIQDTGEPLLRKEIAWLLDQTKNEPERNVLGRLISEHRGLKDRHYAPWYGQDLELPRRLARLSTIFNHDLDHPNAADDCRCASLELVASRTEIKGRIRSEMEANNLVESLRNKLNCISGIINFKPDLKKDTSPEDQIVSAVEDVWADLDRARRTVVIWAERLCKSLSIKQSDFPPMDFENAIVVIENLKCANNKTASTKKRKRP